MRFLNIVVGVLLLCTCHSTVFAKGSNLRLWGAVTANQSTESEELTQNLTLTFSLLNEGSTAIDPIPIVDASRFTINGKQLSEWLNIEKNSFSGFGSGLKKSELLEPGQVYRFTANPGEFLNRPGTYSLQWFVSSFKSAPITIRVLPLREPCRRQSL